MYQSLEKYIYTLEEAAEILTKKCGEVITPSHLIQAAAAKEITLSFFADGIKADIERNVQGGRETVRTTVLNGAIDISSITAFSLIGSPYAEFKYIWYGPMDEECLEEEGIRTTRFRYKLTSMQRWNSGVKEIVDIPDGGLVVSASDLIVTKRELDSMINKDEEKNGGISNREVNTYLEIIAALTVVAYKWDGKKHYAMAKEISGDSSESGFVLSERTLGEKLKLAAEFVT